MRKNLRELAGPALFEAAFVVLGVVLALAANQWRETRQDRQRVSVATNAIAAELQDNRAALVEASAYHLSLLDSLRVKRPASWRPSPAMFSRGFVSPAQLSSTAWQSAAAAGVVEHMPYQVVLRLSRAYASQGRYEHQAQSIGEVIYGELYRTGTQGITGNYRNLSNLIGSFLYRERQLIALYDSTLRVTR
jgi:type II secretory pathway pseudopilin PulG